MLLAPRNKGMVAAVITKRQLAKVAMTPLYLIKCG